jgi:hypothetical protein
MSVVRPMLSCVGVLYAKSPTNHRNVRPAFDIELPYCGILVDLPIKVVPLLPEIDAYLGSFAENPTEEACSFGDLPRLLSKRNPWSQNKVRPDGAAFTNPEFPVLYLLGMLSLFIALPLYDIIRNRRVHPATAWALPC